MNEHRFPPALLPEIISVSSVDEAYALIDELIPNGFVRQSDTLVDDDYAFEVFVVEAPCGHQQTFVFDIRRVLGMVL